jgi:hypothetical protein
MNFVDTLKINQAVIYSENKYRIDKIEQKDNNRLLLLYSLNYPPKIISVLLNKNNNIKCSELETKRGLIKFHIKNSTFKVLIFPEKTEQDIDFKELASEIYEKLIEGYRLYAIINYSFSEVDIENVYIIYKGKSRIIVP